MEDPYLISERGAYLVLTGYLLSCALAILVTTFLVFHLWLVAGEFTTIEFCEKRGSDPRFKQASPYNLGVLNNFKQVLGSQPLLWIFPIRPQRMGDGLFFSVREDTGEVRKLK